MDLARAVSQMKGDLIWSKTRFLLSPYIISQEVTVSPGTF